MEKREKKKPVFGDKEQIELLQLKDKYMGIKPMEFMECECNCPYCDADLELCPYCNKSSFNQFSVDDFCKDCKKEVIPFNISRRITFLENKQLLRIT